MRQAGQFDWVDFYKEFAFKLVSYKEKRAELIQKVKAIYQMTGISMPTLDKDNNIMDIDPFTIFGLFNKGLKNEESNVEKNYNILSRTYSLWNRCSYVFVFRHGSRSSQCI